MTWMPENCHRNIQCSIGWNTWVKFSYKQGRQELKNEYRVQLFAELLLMGLDTARGKKNKQKKQLHSVWFNSQCAPAFLGLGTTLLLPSFTQHCLRKISVGSFLNGHVEKIQQILGASPQSYHLNPSHLWNPSFNVTGEFFLSLSIKDIRKLDQRRKNKKRESSN